MDASIRDNSPVDAHFRLFPIIVSLSSLLNRVGITCLLWPKVISLLKQIGFNENKLPTIEKDFLPRRDADIFSEWGADLEGID